MFRSKMADEEIDNTASKGKEKLPVCIKEIVSEGPGIAFREYRIEVSANSGIKMGHTNIKNDDDLKDVVGPRFSKHLLSGHPNNWNLALAFKFIVQERMKLDTQPKKSKKHNKGRRDGIWLSPDTQGIRDSIVSLVRASDPAEITKEVKRKSKNLAAKTGQKNALLAVAEDEEKHRGKEKR
jgi:hypothetical protein